MALCGQKKIEATVHQEKKECGVSAHLFLECNVSSQNDAQKTSSND
jgi:hypothetical protein